METGRGGGGGGGGGGSGGGMGGSVFCAVLECAFADFALEIVKHQGNGKSEVPSCREAREGNSMGVELEFFGVGGEVDDGVGSIFYTYAEGEFRCESVFDRDEDGFCISHYGPGPPGIIGARPEGESTAVEIDDDGISILFGFEEGIGNIENEFERAAEFGQPGRDLDFEIGMRGFRGREVVEFHPDPHQGSPYCSFHEEYPACGEKAHTNMEMLVDEEALTGPDIGTGRIQTGDQ